MRKRTLIGCRILACLCFFGCAFISFSVLAEEGEDATDSRTIVVTPNRASTPLSQVGGSISVISEEQIERSQATSVAELLRDVPGVDVVRSGGRGGNSSIFLRGANSEHTLVLLDGIELNNPGNPARAFNFADLTLENVERIEILRGPQSGLYGSDAIGGVINIITKEAAKGASLNVSSEGGSHSRFVQKARGAFGGEGINASIGVVQENEHGISAADRRDGNEERDGFDNTSLTLRALLIPSEVVTLDNTLRFNSSLTELDNAGGVFGDDPNRELDNEQLFWRSALKGDFFDGVWKPTIGVSLTDHRFTDNNDVDFDHPGEVQESRYSGRQFKIDWVNSVQLAEDLRAVIGVETEKEKASSRFFSDGPFGPFESLFGEEDLRTNGYFFDLTSSPFSHFTTSAAIRVDDYDNFGSEVTYRISPVYFLESSDTKFRGSVGTGFKAPSLSQLYSSFGNPQLEPEKSRGWEIGVDQVVLDGTVTFGGTFYRNVIDQLISFNSETFIVENIADADISGFELYLETELFDQLILRTDYTYLDAKDGSTYEQLIRRARNQIGVSADYRFADERGLFGAEVTYVGERYDTDFSSFPSRRAKLGGYSLVDLFSSFELTPELKIFARVENLFDKEYQEVYGFGTYGLRAFGGVEVRI